MQVHERVFQILQVALWSSDYLNYLVNIGILCEIDYDLRWSIYIENVDDKSEWKTDSLTLLVVAQKSYKIWRKNFENIWNKNYIFKFPFFFRTEVFSIFKHMLLLVK
jgi:hypothetical protein